MRLAQPAVFAGGLHGGGGFHRLAEGLHRDPRRGRDMFVRCARLGVRCRQACVFGDGDLVCVFDHFPRSLILALSKLALYVPDGLSPLRYLSIATERRAS